MKSYLTVGGLVLLLSGLLFVWIYHNEYTWQREKFLEESRMLLGDAERILQRELQTAAADVMYQASLSEIESFEDTEHQQHMYEGMRTFIALKPHYDQLRIIDTTGKERLRIGREDGKAVIADAADLQHKINRYYVREALQFGPGELYLSPLDLNVENGAVEIPYKPVIRIATPIFDTYGNKTGILIINYRFQGVLDHLQQNSRRLGVDLLLANSRGAWLIAPEGEEAWRFMFGDIGNQLYRWRPALWNALLAGGSSLLTGETLLSFQSIEPLRLLQRPHLMAEQSFSEILRHAMHGPESSWYMILSVRPERVAEEVWQNVYKGLPYLVIGTGLLLALTWYLLHLYRRLLASAHDLRLAATCFENADDGMVITDAQSGILKINRRYGEITGYDEEEIVGSTPNILASGWTSEETYDAMWEAINTQGHWEGEIQDRAKDGRMYAQWLRVIAIKDALGRVQNYLGVCTDITDRKASEEKIRKLAYEDSLTGLPNRVLFLNRLEHAIDKARRYEQTLALIFIDLDNFKIVNDTAGHLVGDRFLIEIAHRFKSLLRSSDTLARTGGDEFLLLMEFADAPVAAETAERILASMTESVTVEAHEYYTSASIGIAVYPFDATDGEGMIKHADTAMYKAKEGGKGRYRFFEAQMNREVIRRLQIEKNLKRAVKEGAFHIVLQPQVSLHSFTIVGAEALLRWECEALGSVNPSDFIPLAESTGQIVPITMWVLEAVCTAQKRLQEMECELIPIAVNISSFHIKEESFVESIYGCVIGMGVAPQLIELEITEGALIDNVEDTVRKLKALREYGFRISIDDFGTGYSSLSYLKQFDFDKLKIDRAFIDDLPDDKEDAEITRSIIAISKVMEMWVVAEGAETREQVDFLAANGCDKVQGYFFSRPLPFESFVGFCRGFDYSAALESPPEV